MSDSARRKTPAEGRELVRRRGRGLKARQGVRLTLRVLREGVGRTQQEVAAEARMDQADVSRLERRDRLDDCQLATLRRYVEALGGELEVAARFGKKRVLVVGKAGD